MIINLISFTYTENEENKIAVYANTVILQKRLLAFAFTRFIIVPYIIMR